MSDSRPESRNTTLRRFVFLLLPNYSLIAFSNAVEALRLANRMVRRPIYSWHVVTESGAAVACSSGLKITPDGGLEACAREDTVLVCGGSGIKRAVNDKLMHWLRREARKGVIMGGLCTGTYLLAKAGLLAGHTTTIHWENRASLIEEFPDLEVSTAVFVVNKNRYSAAGGAAAADLMLNLISRDHGVDLANAVADQMIYTTARTDKDEQRLSIPTRIGVRHPKLSGVIKMMEGNLEEPISPPELAAQAGVSTRQLERLFRRYLSRSPKRYYMELRLQKARNLLMQTDMSVINVALASGFASPSHFSKCYRAHFNTTPYRERGTQEANPDPL
ncbi:MAG: GlxA family transcriptional regulator [Rhodobacteraceae bacterium]|nr:GlxA family transcriptional regulator [Paracoccaceae bacterium]